MQVTKEEGKQQSLNIDRGPICCFKLSVKGCISAWHIFYLFWILSVLVYEVFTFSMVTDNIRMISNYNNIVNNNIASNNINSNGLTGNLINWNDTLKEIQTAKITLNRQFNLLIASISLIGFLILGHLMAFISIRRASIYGIKTSIFVCCVTLTGSFTMIMLSDVVAEAYVQLAIHSGASVLSFGLLGVLIYYDLKYLRWIRELNEISDVDQVASNK